MRQGIGSLVVALAVGLLCAFPSYAATNEIAEGMKEKAVRGVINLVTGIIEIPVQVCKGYRKGFEPIKNEAGSKVVGTVLGIFRGFGHAAGRTSWGALELFGFWTANPKDNEGVGVPLDAEYAWEEGVQHSYFEPSLAEGVKPVGRKLVRGLANTFVGIAELPGQILQGKREGQILKGLGRGVWFWFSREAYGFAGIYSSIVPNPRDNPGYAFDGEWPWSVLAEETK